MRIPAAVILAGAVLLAVAVAEARGSRGSEAWLDGTARAEAVKAARLFAAMSAHMRASNADRRFAERLAADEPVVDEILADIAWVQHRGREERPRLMDFRAGEVRAAGAGFAELTAREYWVTRSVGSGGEAVQTDVVQVRYALRRTGLGWRVADWMFDSGAASETRPIE